MTMHGKALDHDTSRRLVTDLVYLGAGEAAIADLQSRLDTITGADNRIVVGEIKTDEVGHPVCGISFDCSSYENDDDALRDLGRIIGMGNPDGCLWWQNVEMIADDLVSKVSITA